MINLTHEYEIFFRLGFFFSILIIIILLELYFPRRERSFSRLTRWPSNLGLVFLNAGLIRLVLPFIPVTLAIIAGHRGWGLFNNLSINYWLAVILSVLVFDLVIYLQHVMFHAVPLFWRLHRMHHTDLDFDVTTGLRFHPIEIILSIFIKLAVVLVLGTPALSVLIFEILLNATSMFNHGNFYIPIKLDRILRLFVVTPDMHRVHHSIIRRETNSNFGFNLPWWDRIMGTYRAQPEEGHLGMTIGINQFRHMKYLKLGWLIAIPFINDKES